jgi:putative xylitol transport system permease protein
MLSARAASRSSTPAASRCPNLTEGFRFMGTGAVGGIPMPVIIFALVFLVAWWVLGQSRFGRQVYAWAATPMPRPCRASRSRGCGCRVFVISGALAGLAGHDARGADGLGADPGGHRLRARRHRRGGDRGHRRSAGAWGA